MAGIERDAERETFGASCGRTARSLFGAATKENPMQQNESPLPQDDSLTAWMSQGNCRNYPPAVFFPSDGVGVDRARKICVDCPVVDQCLEYALDERIEHGVWGGCSERERRRILKRRRVATSN
jgi:WhiB family transcriptional regulator, redox-sensing transcriptional regulator